MVWKSKFPHHLFLESKFSLLTSQKNNPPRLFPGGLVRAEGFEPSTLGAEIRYSIQLNYARYL